MAPNPWTPWLPWWSPSSVEQPLSGDVTQWLRVFSPTVTVHGRGNPELEAAIVRDVATYGAQLGPLIDIVVAQVAGTPPPPDAVAKLRDIQRDVEARKEEYRTGCRERARKALDELREHDPEALATLVGEFRPPA